MPLTATPERLQPGSCSLVIESVYVSPPPMFFLLIPAVPLLAQLALQYGYSDGFTKRHGAARRGGLRGDGNRGN
jgi:hypothetical protein